MLKKRNLFLPSIVLLISLIFIMVDATGISGAASLTLLHTNDTHSHLLPFSYPSLGNVSPPLPNLQEHENIGGIARRATLARQIRNELKSKGVPVWLVDAGDFSDGTPFSIEYHGEADIAAMNAAGYDFAALGNHEFIDTLPQTCKLIRMARFPILCANALLQTTGKPLARPYIIKEVDTVRIGIFGLITRETSVYPAARKGVIVTDEIEAARKMVTILHSQKADIIILISHCGQEMDKRLASFVRGIDIIVGGHSHSRLPYGEFMRRPEDLQADELNGTLIVQAHQWGGELGRCDLFFKKNSLGIWRVTRYRTRLLPITAAVYPDPQVAAVVEQYWKPIASRYTEIIGWAADDFTNRGEDWAEYHLMADAVRETFGIEIEIENMGGVRSSLAKGKITLANLVDLDPFNNTVVLFTMTGLKLREILEKYAPAVSGIRYRMNNGKLVDVTINGRPLQKNRLYTGATNSYFAEMALQGIEIRDTQKLRRAVLVDYILKQKTIRPAHDGRRVVIGD